MDLMSVMHKVEELPSRMTRPQQVQENRNSLMKSGQCGADPVDGRAAPGEQVVEATPSHSGAHYTLVAAPGWTGVEAL
jgi:hypothetical protein